MHDPVLNIVLQSANEILVARLEIYLLVFFPSIKENLMIMPKNKITVSCNNHTDRKMV